MNKRRRKKVADPVLDARQLAVLRKAHPKKKYFIVAVGIDSYGDYKTVKVNRDGRPCK